MTDEAIEKQIRIIKEATVEATKTKESALKFLIDAGILKAPVTKNSEKKK